MTPKDNYLSIAKAIGIILMVVGHTIGPNFFCRFIYMFHMPLFFFCSGYFYKEPQNFNQIEEFVIKRIKGLYFPYLKWCFIFLMLHNLFYGFHFYPMENDYYSCYSIGDYMRHMKSILTTMTGQDKLLDPFWFLKELLFSSIFICLITYTIKSLTSKYKVCLLWFMLVFFTVITKPDELGIPVIWNLSILFLSATFYYSGHLYRKVEKAKFYNLIGLLLSTAVVLSVVLIWNDSLDMLWYDASSVLLYIPTALVGIYMVLTLSFFLERFHIRRIFYYIGKNTLIILSLHLLVFKLVSCIIILAYGLPIDKLADTYIHEYNQYFWLIYVAFGLSVPLLCHEFYVIVLAKLSYKKW